MIRAARVLALLAALDAAAALRQPLFIVRLVVDVALAPLGLALYARLGRSAKNEDISRALAEHPAAQGGRLRRWLEKMLEENQS